MRRVNRRQRGMSDRLSMSRTHYVHGGKCHNKTSYFVKLICVQNFK